MIVPARRKSLYEDISNQILEMISEGKWTEGERIPGEIELSNMFEVSRNSMRESIKALELIGILRAKSGRGTYVSDQAIARIQQIKFSNVPEDDYSIDEIMEFRLLIEPSVVRAATRLAGKDDFTRLRGILEQGVKAVHEQKYDFELGFSFHSTLFKIVDNRIVNGLVDQLNDKLIAVRKKVFVKHFNPKIFLAELDEHRVILDLMEAGEAEKAASAMEKHIADSLALLKNTKVKT
ncbi:MAG: FadR/GntR family transcriptional regulator [Treponemataceae bacterium]